MKCVFQPIHIYPKKPLSKISAVTTLTVPSVWQWVSELLFYDAMLLYMMLKVRRDFSTQGVDLEHPVTIP